MKIEKINVQTSNKKHATDIAMLVDKLEFLQEIQRLRGKWQITDQYKGKNDRVNERLLYNCTTLSQTEVEKRLPEFKADIHGVLHTFNRGKNFRLLVIHALITGVIPEGLYQSCYFDIVTINEKADINKPEKYQYVIVLSPRAEQKEVVQAYKEFKRHIKGYEGNEYEMGEMGKIKFHELSKDNKLSMEDPDDVAVIEHYYKGNVYTSADVDKFKTLRELEQAREWYWLRYEQHFNDPTTKELTYPETLKAWQRKHCDIFRANEKVKQFEYPKACSCRYCKFTEDKTIEKSVITYENLLEES